MRRAKSCSGTGDAFSFLVSASSSWSVRSSPPHGSCCLHWHSCCGRCHTVVEPHWSSSAQAVPLRLCFYSRHIYFDSPTSTTALLPRSGCIFLRRQSSRRSSFVRRRSSIYAKLRPPCCCSCSHCSPTFHGVGPASSAILPLCSWCFSFSSWHLRCPEPEARPSTSSRFPS